MASLLSSSAASANLPGLLLGPLILPGGGGILALRQLASVDRDATPLLFASNVTAPDVLSGIQGATIGANNLISGDNWESHAELTSSTSHRPAMAKAMAEMGIKYGALTFSHPALSEPVGGHWVSLSPPNTTTTMRNPTIHHLFNAAIASTISKTGSNSTAVFDNFALASTITDAMQHLDALAHHPQHNDSSPLRRSATKFFDPHKIQYRLCQWLTLGSDQCDETNLARRTLLLPRFDRNHWGPRLCKFFTLGSDQCDEMGDLNHVSKRSPLPGGLSKRSDWKDFEYKLCKWVTYGSDQCDEMTVDERRRSEGHWKGDPRVVESWQHAVCEFMLLGADRCDEGRWHGDHW